MIAFVAVRKRCAACAKFPRKGVLLFSISMLVLLSACGGKKVDNHTVRDDSYFKKEKVHYIIDGKKYAVPMGYQWYQHVKYSQWPTPKEEYTETTGFSVDALLPDFLPYSNENAARFDNVRGHGDKVEVRVGSVLQRQKPIGELFSYWKDTGGSLDRLPPSPEAVELVHYVHKPGKNSPEVSWRDIYLPSNLDVGEFWIECRLGVSSPACNLYDYGGSEGPTYESVFALKYLSRWREIRKQSTELISSFVIQQPTSK